LSENYIRVFVTMKAENFGFTTQVEVDDPKVVDDLDLVARAVARFNEWFDRAGDEWFVYEKIRVDDRELPVRPYQHICIHGGELVSFVHHLDLDAYRDDIGMDDEASK